MSADSVGTRATRLDKKNVKMATDVATLILSVFLLAVIVIG